MYNINIDCQKLLFADYCFIRLIQIRRTKNELQQVFLVEYYFHDVVFGYPYESLHSLIPFGFRPISLGAVSSRSWCFLHSSFHKITFNYYRLIIRFSPSWSLSRTSLLWLLLNSHCKLYSVHFVKKLVHTSVKPPRIRVLSFHLIPVLFIPTVSNSYRALICHATLSTVKCLVWSFCPLVQMLAVDFFQIPIHDGPPPYHWLCDSRY